MIFFALCYGRLLSIQQAGVNRKLEEAKLALSQAKEHYADLLAQGTSAELSDFGLSKREITLLLLDGKSGEKITRLLAISMGTVNSHCSNIYRKAGVNSAIKLATRMLLEGR